VLNRHSHIYVAQPQGFKGLTHRSWRRGSPGERESDTVSTLRVEKVFTCLSGATTRILRCTYDSTSRAMSKLKTWLTWERERVIRSVLYVLNRHSHIHVAQPQGYEGLTHRNWRRGSPGERESDKFSTLRVAFTYLCGAATRIGRMNPSKLKTWLTWREREWYGEYSTCWKGIHMFKWRNHKDTPVDVRLDVARHVEVEDVAHLDRVKG